MTRRAAETGLYEYICTTKAGHWIGSTHPLSSACPVVTLGTPCRGALEPFGARSRKYVSEAKARARIVR